MIYNFGCFCLRFCEDKLPAFKDKLIYIWSIRSVFSIEVFLNDFINVEMWDIFIFSQWEFEMALWFWNVSILNFGHINRIFKLKIILNSTDTCKSHLIYSKL